MEKYKYALISNPLNWAQAEAYSVFKVLTAATKTSSDRSAGSQSPEPTFHLTAI